MLCSICIFIGLLVVKTDINNEELIKREQKYFDIAFKVFLWVSFIGYALVLPKTIISNNNSWFSANLLINILMMSSMFLGYGILRLKKIYFNFKFISEENKIYYKGVFKNIWKIIRFFIIIYLIAFFVAIAYIIKNNSTAFLTTILKELIVAVLTTSSFYLFISFLERFLYIEDDKKAITTPTIIVFIIFGLHSIINVSLNLFSDFYYLEITNGNINFDKYINFVNLINKAYNVLYYFKYFKELSILFLAADLFKKKDVLK